MIDDVLEYIAGLGDKAKDQASLQSPTETLDDKAIIDTTIADVLSVLPERSLPEVCLLQSVVCVCVYCIHPSTPCTGHILYIQIILAPPN